jgi:hypothetical protein
VQARAPVAVPSTVAVLLAGQRIANTTFLPSALASGSETSPTPLVKRAVRLCSRALGLLFSRSIRSPPGAVGVPSVGFMPTAVARLA